jgi:hypothetical protein
MTTTAHDANAPQGGAGDAHGPPRVQLQVQTPRGLWNMTTPANADRRPEYAISTLVQAVIDDARAVFKFVENDSKYTLHFGQVTLAPERTLASYKLAQDTLVVLSVQGGNAMEKA